MPQYNVPREIQLIANRALEYNRSLPQSKRAAYKTKSNGERVPGTGMLTARRLASGRVDASQIELMAAWFARHGAANKEQRRDRTSKMAIAWALWGGTPAQRWVNRMAKQINNDK
jgi:hypothetical protein